MNTASPGSVKLGGYSSISAFLQVIQLVVNHHCGPFDPNLHLLPQAQLRLLAVCTVRNPQHDPVHITQARYMAVVLNV